MNRTRLSGRGRTLRTLFLAAVVSFAADFPALAQQGAELTRWLSEVLAPPPLKAESGFTARVLVPPGELYDPLYLIPQGTGALLSDDGNSNHGKQGRLLSIDQQGRITVLAGMGMLVVPIGIGIAPPSFGPDSGKIYVLSQAVPMREGVFANHVVQRLDPAQKYTASTVCTLPSANGRKSPTSAKVASVFDGPRATAQAQGVSGTGFDARFGPAGTPFADKFFALTVLNATIYQVAPNGACTPFVSFSGPTDSPNGIGFTPDGKHMLVSLRSGNAGSIRRVTPEGKIEPQPFAEGFDSPSGLAFAPNGFGAYGGQLFVADRGSKPSTGAAARAEPEGRIYRVTPDGQRHLVASGLYNPIGLSFFDGKLWVTDINSDYIGGRELPDGVLVEIHPR